ncbi:hypothetical protein NUW54_g10301 [Trametes sanguinea]|uniref:Uncharacterized protein n=1 Tax=Trametes sanguinea TaxID=158606 RepID=A0ACC1P066_9APHY|nr:hypothetical protein NUW54_g10301 [Trametes sanguinea]
MLCAHDEDDTHDGASVEHPVLDFAQKGMMGPTMEAEEPESAELDGHFNQPMGEHATSSASNVDSATPARSA